MCCVFNQSKCDNHRQQGRKCKAKQNVSIDRLISTCPEQSLDTAAMLQAMPGRNGFGNNMLDT